MAKETLRMQMLAGLITESEYKAKLEESKKDSLNEHYVAGGIVGIGAINQIPPRAKTDYEMAFEHFLGQKYSLNEEEDVEEGKEVEEPSLYENKALGTLFYKDEDGDYLYNENKFMELIKNMGYEDAEEIAKEIMTISSPEDSLKMFRNKYNQPDLEIEDVTLDMVKKSIEDEFEK